MRVCTICNHESKQQIDECLVSGESYRSIAKQFAVSPSAVNRHKEHIPASLTAAKQATQAADATTLLSRVEALMVRCEGLFEGASEAKKWAGAAAAARELRGCLELIGKLSGELSNGGVNILVKQSFANLSLKDFTDEQLRDLRDLILAEHDLPFNMTDGEIERELSSIFGVDAGAQSRLPTPVMFTEVERLIHCGFAHDSELVRGALKKKEAAVRAYQDSIAPAQAQTIPGVRYQIESQSRN